MWKMSHVQTHSFLQFFIHLSTLYLYVITGSSGGVRNTAPFSTSLFKSWTLQQKEVLLSLSDVCHVCGV